MFHLQREGEIVRKVARSEMKIAKMHDEWSTEKLYERKQNLEEMMSEMIGSGDNHDKVLLHLRTRIALAERVVEASRETIKELAALTGKVFPKDSSSEIVPGQMPRAASVKNFQDAPSDEIKLVAVSP